MVHPLTRRHMLAWALAAALALLALAAPAPSSAAAAAAVPDRSYLAQGPERLHLAITVHAGRLEAYACDGTSCRAYFAGRARRGSSTLHNRNGDRLALRLGTRSAHSTLTLKGDEPLQLTARPTRVAIFTATIRPDGAVTGTAPGGGVLGAHLSGLGLVGALALPGHDPRAFSESGIAAAPLHVDGQPVAYPPDRAAEALQGEWRWIVTPTRIVGATTKFIELEGDLAVPAGTKFIDLNSDL